MARPDDRHSDNVPGAWYVDSSCVPCNLCLEEAPALLKYNEDFSYAFFSKQPETPEELEAARRASKACPTEAIGNDG